MCKWISGAVSWQHCDDWNRNRTPLDQSIWKCKTFYSAPTCPNSCNAFSSVRIWHFKVLFHVFRKRFPFPIESINMFGIGIDRIINKYAHKIDWIDGEMRNRRNAIRIANNGWTCVLCAAILYTKVAAVCVVCLLDGGDHVLEFIMIMCGAFWRSEFSVRPNNLRTDMMICCCATTHANIASERAHATRNLQ